MSSPQPLNPNQAVPEPDPQQRIHELEAQLVQERIERTAAEFDLPPALLADASTPEGIDRIASAALLWRAETQPAPAPPATGAVDASWANGTGVIGAADRILPRYQQVQTRDAVSRMAPAEILSAWRAGHLSQIGVGAPTANGSTPLTRRG